MTIRERQYFIAYTTDPARLSRADSPAAELPFPTNTPCHLLPAPGARTAQKLRQRRRHTGDIAFACHFIHILETKRSFVARSQLLRLSMCQRRIRRARECCHYLSCRGSHLLTRCLATPSHQILARARIGLVITPAAEAFPRGVFPFRELHYSKGSPCHFQVRRSLCPA
jgi:hypothetical protein